MIQTYCVRNSSHSSSAGSLSCRSRSTHSASCLGLDWKLWTEKITGRKQGDKELEVSCKMGAHEELLAMSPPPYFLPHNIKFFILILSFSNIFLCCKIQKVQTSNFFDRFVLFAGAFCRHKLFWEITIFKQCPAYIAFLKKPEVHTW